MGLQRRHKKNRSSLPDESGQVPREGMVSIEKSFHAITNSEPIFSCKNDWQWEGVLLSEAKCLSPSFYFEVFRTVFCKPKRSQVVRKITCCWCRVWQHQDPWYSQQVSWLPLFRKGWEDTNDRIAWGKCSSLSFPSFWGHVLHPQPTQWPLIRHKKAEILWSWIWRNITDTEELRWRRRPPSE